MKINDEILNKIRELTADIDKKNELASELMRVAKDRFGETTVSIERKVKGSDNKFIQAKQNDLWQEVYQLGTESQAGKVLKEKHPAVFAAFEGANELVKELNTIAIMELDLKSYQQISLKDIVNLAEGIAEWKVRKLVDDKCLNSIEVEVGEDKEDNNK